MKRGFASTIVMVSVYSIALIMSALIVATPSKAFASDGFLGGLQDLVGAREVEGVNDYEGEYLNDYDPQLRVDPPDPGTNTLMDLGDDATTVDYVNETLESFNGVEMAGRKYTLLATVSRFFCTPGALGNVMTTTLFLPAVGLVFMWWGVRKSLKVVMSAFRKGSMNV